MQEKKTKEKGNGRVRCMLVAFFILLFLHALGFVTLVTYFVMAGQDTLSIYGKINKIANLCTCLAIKGFNMLLFSPIFL